METRREQFRVDKGYSCRVFVEFTDLDSDEDIETPVEGELKLILGDKVPHPVETGIDDIENSNGNASYVEFEQRRRTVQNPEAYPVIFPFTTNPASEKGGKWYFYRTADWSPDPEIEPYENPEFVKHHVAIPSAQKIRLVHRILNGDAGAETMATLTQLYDMNKAEAVSEFSEDVKGHVGFEARTQIQDFLMEYSNFERTHSDAVNKVAKQLVKSEYCHRVNSVEDLERMVGVVNETTNLPDISIEEVLQRIRERSDEQELQEIANHLGEDEWSAVALDS